MKRSDLVRHLVSHSVYVNPSVRRISTVPRHREINDHLASKICRDLDVVIP